MLLLKQQFGALAWDMWRAPRAGVGILERQQRRLADIVAYARKHARFYATRDDAPVTKPQLLAAFADWVTDPALQRADLDAFARDPRTIGSDFLGKYAVFTTSGSSGVPVVLAHDARELAVFAALSLVRGTAAWLTPLELARLALGGQRLAAVFVTEAHLPTAAIAHRQRRQGRAVQLFSVLSPMPRLVEALNTFQPTRVDSYPSALAMLAAEQRAGRLRISPNLLTCVGETLTPDIRALVQEAFGRPLFQHYSTAETGPIAFECRRQTLHVNEDWLILEPVDAHGRTVPPGTTSHAVRVTSLVNRVQPLLRYEISDSVRVHAEPCPCGSPFAAVSVAGPRDEPLDLVSSAGATRLWPLVVYGRLKQVSEIARYQVIQDGPAALTLRLEARPDADVEVAWRAAEAALHELAALPGLTIARALEPPAPHARSGKFRFQWRTERGSGNDQLS